MSTATIGRRKKRTRAGGSAFSRRLKQLLRRTKLLPGVLAARAGVDESSIHRYIRGSYEPNLRHVRAIARALGVAPTRLVDGGEVTAVTERGRVLLYRGTELVGVWLERDIPAVIHPIAPSPRPRSS